MDTQPGAKRRAAACTQAWLDLQSHLLTEGRLVLPAKNLAFPSEANPGTETFRYSALGEVSGSSSLCCR